MFAHKILSQCSNECGAPYFSFNNEPPNHDDLDKSTISRGRYPIILRGPERDKFLDEALFDEIIRGGGGIFMVTQVRHPLDLIVSQYFSHGWLHPEKYF